jgi:hypothetical protein
MHLVKSFHCDASIVIHSMSRVEGESNPSPAPSSEGPQAISSHALPVSSARMHRRLDGLEQRIESLLERRRERECVVYGQNHGHVQTYVTATTNSHSCRIQRMVS